MKPAKKNKKIQKTIAFFAFGLVALMLFFGSLWSRINTHRRVSRDKEIKSQDNDSSSEKRIASRSQENENSSLFVSCGGFIE